MAIERATAFEGSQWGPETTPGVGVAALKRLLCTGVTFAPNIPVEPYVPLGSKVATTATKQKEWTEGDLDGRACFNDFCYLFAGALCLPTITTPGGATLTRRWNFKPKTWAPDAVQTFSIEKGSPAYAERALSAYIDSLTVRFSQEDAAVSGSILAQEIDYNAYLSTSEVQRVSLGGATGGTFTLAFGANTTAALAWNISAAALLTALTGLASIGVGNVLVTLVSAGLYEIKFINTLGQQNVASLVIDATLLTGGGATAVTTPTAGVAPTEIPEMPMDTDRVSIWTGADVAGLARLRRVSEIEWAISDRFTGQFTLDDEEPSFSAVVEKVPSISAQVTMQRNDDAKALIGYLRAKTTRVWRIQVLGPDVEVGFPHRMTITFPEKTRDPRHGSAQDAETGQFELFNVHDSAFGGWVEVEIDCALTSL